MVPEALPRKKDEERIQRRPPQDTSSRKGKAGLILPMIRQMLGKPKDNGRTVNGKINHGMIGPGTSLRKPMQQKEKERKEGQRKRQVKEGREVRLQGWSSPACRCCPERYHNCYCYNVLP